MKGLNLTKFISCNGSEGEWSCSKVQTGSPTFLRFRRIRFFLFPDPWSEFLEIELGEVEDLDRTQRKPEMDVRPEVVETRQQVQVEVQVSRPKISDLLRL